MLTILLQSQCNSMTRLSKHFLMNLFLPQICKGKWNCVRLCYTSECLVFPGSVLYCLWLSKKILFLHNTECWTQWKSELLGVIFILLECSKRSDISLVNFHYNLLTMSWELRTWSPKLCFLNSVICATLARGKSWHFAMPPLVWETCAETPYWWHNTAHCYWLKICFIQSEAFHKFQLLKYKELLYLRKLGKTWNRIWQCLTRRSPQVNNIIIRLFYYPDLGSYGSSVWNFCSHFSGLKIKKIFRSPFGDYWRNNYSHQMQIFGCQFVQCKWCSS